MYSAYSTHTIVHTQYSTCPRVQVRISGGIYSKAADIGQSVLGKLEEDIPTPDKDNPGEWSDLPL